VSQNKRKITKRGIVRKNVRLKGQVNKSNIGEAELPGNIQKKLRKRGEPSKHRVQWGNER
jgi:hypothetical protein